MFFVSRFNKIFIKSAVKKIINCIYPALFIVFLKHSIVSIFIKVTIQWRQDNLNGG